MANDDAENPLPVEIRQEKSAVYFAFCKRMLTLTVQLFCNVVLSWNSKSKIVEGRRHASTAPKICVLRPPNSDYECNRQETY
jgi:hypothetical protein